MLILLKLKLAVFNEIRIFPIKSTIANKINPSSVVVIDHTIMKRPIILHNFFFMTLFFPWSFQTIFWSVSLNKTVLITINITLLRWIALEKIYFLYVYMRVFIFDWCYPWDWPRRFIQVWVIWVWYLFVLIGQISRAKRLIWGNHIQWPTFLHNNYLLLKVSLYFLLVSVSVLDILCQITHTLLKA